MQNCGRGCHDSIASVVEHWKRVFVFFDTLADEGFRESRSSLKVREVGDREAAFVIRHKSTALARLLLWALPCHSYTKFGIELSSFVEVIKGQPTPISLQTPQMPFQRHQTGGYG